MKFLLILSILALSFASKTTFENETNLNQNWFSNLMFKAMKQELNGFIDGYDGKTRTLPATCLDPQFQDHLIRKTWILFRDTFTAKNWNKIDFQHEVAMLAVTMFSELMTEC